jgi:hypothetical protein
LAYVVYALLPSRGKKFPKKIELGDKNEFVLNLRARSANMIQLLIVVK